MISVVLSGGGVFWTIIAIGMIVTVIFFLRFFDLRRAHVAYEDFMSGVENLIEKGNDREALAICDDTSAPVSRVVAAAIRRRHAPPAAIREAAEIAARMEIRRFSRRLTVLQSFAQALPLIGLFGTVVGFADAVKAVSAKTLATRSDILPLMSPALACAAAGLLVAVLAHAMHAILRGRLDHLTADLDSAVNDIIVRLGGGDV